MERKRLKERLANDMVGALKGKNKLRLSVIRLLRAAIKNEEIEIRKELTDPEVIQVVKRSLKQRKEAIEEFKRGNREDLVQKEAAEADILKEYLPEPFTPQEIAQIIDQVIEEVGARDLKDFGRVMKGIMEKAPGRVDGKIANQLVRETLSAG
jgi:hypothetical protein